MHYSIVLVYKVPKELDQLHPMLAVLRWLRTPAGKRAFMISTAWTVSKQEECIEIRIRSPYLRDSQRVATLLEQNLQKAGFEAIRNLRPEHKPAEAKPPKRHSPRPLLGAREVWFYLREDASNTPKTKYEIATGMGKPSSYVNSHLRHLVLLGLAEQCGTAPKVTGGQRLVLYRLTAKGMRDDNPSFYLTEAA